MVDNPQYRDGLCIDVAGRGDALRRALLLLLASVLSVLRYPIQVEERANRESVSTSSTRLRGEHHRVFD
jgi:hypothetical protein